MKKLLNYVTIVFTVLLFSSCETEKLEGPQQEVNLTSTIQPEAQHRDGEKATAYMEWEEGTDEDMKRQIREDLIIREFLIEYIVCKEKPNGEVWVYCPECKGKPKVKVPSIPNHSRWVPDGNCYDN